MRVSAAMVLVVVPCLVLGCDDRRTRHDGGSSTSDARVGIDSGSSTSGLRIVELTTSSETLTEGEDVLVRARLEDPDGLDDIVSFFVLQDGERVVTALGPTPTFGVYEGHLAFALFHEEARPLAFVGSIQPELVVRVTDGVGNTDQRPLTLRLVCGDGSSRHGACDGACVELASDRENCGACGNVCPSDASEGGCVEGACFGPTECMPFDGSRTCAAECAAQGGTCAEACFTAFEDEPHGSLSGTLDYCSHVSWWYLTTVGSCGSNAGSGYIRCCCSTP